MSQKKHSEKRVSRLPLLQQLCDTILNLPECPPLGPDFSGLSGGALADALVTHRIRSVYEVPVSGRAAERKQESIASVLQYDEEGFTYPSVENIHDEMRVLRARGIIRSIDQHFRPSYRLVFPTGESATSTRGSPDFYHKLHDIRYWECSCASFGYVSKIFYKNPHMRRLVKRKFYDYCQRELTWDRSMCRAHNQELWASGKSGFQIFQHMFSYLVTLRETSRLTTVPKNNSKDRVITCEPFLTMVCQLSVMQDLRTALTRATGLDLRVLQDWHGARLRSGDATIDLKNASNSVWLPVVKRFFGGTKMYPVIMNLRTPITEYDGNYHQFNMYSPMGCGLTFDVMTILLLSISRTFCPYASVFGDDIMVPTEYARELCEFLSKHGFVVNNNKSFLSGNFRESCGYFADLKHDKLLTSFEMRRPTTLTEVFSFVNKLYRIIEADEVTPLLRGRLCALYFNLVEAIPSDAWRKPHPLMEEIPDDSVIVDWAVGTPYYHEGLKRTLHLYKSTSTKPSRADVCEDDRDLETWRLLRMRYGYPVQGRPRIHQELRDMVLSTYIGRHDAG